ncbi:hypothetical protein F5884DRAFT_843803 [Xylogone sp. PMI_703]|nr:hypothetical protein F5884DRAFT_843803 [Xylogone sp. PMI_703]
MQSAPEELGDIRKSVDHHQSLLPQSNLLSNSSDKTMPRKRSLLPWKPIPWMHEVICWICGLCFFIAAVIVLRVLDHRPLPDLRFGITPNAIVGLLATFAQAFLLVPVSSAIGQIKWLQAYPKKPMDNFRIIDESSRGPWGSFLLLVHQKGGLIGSFGAFVTIVALGFNTFFQQALNYGIVYPYSDDASIPIAQYMNGTGTASIGNRGSVGGVDTTLPAAPYIALFSPPHTPFTAAATTRCGTGNCTWDSYQTLSICNTCENLTSKLKMTKVHIVTDNAVNTSYNTDYYTLPNGFGLTGIQPGQLDTAFEFFTSNAMLNTTTTYSPIHSTGSSGLMSVFAVGASPGTIPAQPDSNYTAGSMTGSPFALPIAFECLLQFCVRSMQAEFVNGTLFETEVSNWTDQSQPPPDLLGNDPDITLQPPGSPTAFVATGDALYGTRNWLFQLLIGNATNSHSPTGWNIEALGYSSDLMQAFYLAMNSSETAFPDLMDNLANRLSLSLRELSYQPSPVLGKAFSSTSHAVVTWPWLILPIFELVASLVFFIAVILETRKKGLVPWTNNILAYFFHGLDGRPPNRHARESQDAMEDKARDLLVEFQPHKDGGSLVVVKP